MIDASSQRCFCEPCNAMNHLWLGQMNAWWFNYYHFGGPLGELEPSLERWKCIKVIVCWDTHFMGQFLTDSLGKQESLYDWAIIAFVLREGQGDLLKYNTSRDCDSSSSSSSSSSSKKKKSFLVCLFVLVSILGGQNWPISRKYVLCFRDPVNLWSHCCPIYFYSRSKTH